MRKLYVLKVNEQIWNKVLGFDRECDLCVAGLQDSIVTASSTYYSWQLMSYWRPEKARAALTFKQFPLGFLTLSLRAMLILNSHTKREILWKHCWVINQKQFATAQTSYKSDSKLESKMMASDVQSRQRYSSYQQYSPNQRNHFYPRGGNFSPQQQGNCYQRQQFQNQPASKTVQCRNGRGKGKILHWWPHR